MSVGHVQACPDFYYRLVVLDLDYSSRDRPVLQAQQNTQIAIQRNSGLADENWLYCLHASSTQLIVSASLSTNSAGVWVACTQIALPQVVIGSMIELQPLRCNLGRDVNVRALCSSESGVLITACAGHRVGGRRPFS